MNINLCLRLPWQRVLIGFLNSCDWSEGAQSGMCYKRFNVTAKTIGRLMIWWPHPQHTYVAQHTLCDTHHTQHTPTTHQPDMHKQTHAHGGACTRMHTRTHMLTLSALQFFVGMATAQMYQFEYESFSSFLIGSCHNSAVTDIVFPRSVADRTLPD